MLATLAGSWNWLLVRGVIATLFGLVTLIWPELTLRGLVILFGVYGLTDGLAAFLIALRGRGLPGFGSLLFESVVGMGAGIVTLAFSAVTDRALLIIIAVWAGCRGVAAIAAAAALRKELTGEWPLPLAGSASLVFGVLLMLRPNTGALSVRWMTGLYALLVGAAFVAFSLRMRQLAHELRAA